MAESGEVLALIPARGGSKSIPRKNIRLLAGFPLIAYSIRAGLAAQTVQRVVVSTDDEQIAPIARRFGAETPFVRPPEGVITSAAWFFGVVGVLEFVAASLRWALRWTRLRVAGRILAGAGDLVFSALLFLYSAKSIPGAFLLAILAGTVGVLLLIYVTLGLYWATARPMPRPEGVQPPARQ